MTNTAKNRIEFEEEELPSPTTHPVSLNKCLEDTESTGSMNESISVFSFANSNDSQNFETSFSFEMELVRDDEYEGGTISVATKNRKMRRPSQGQCIPLPRPSRNVPRKTPPSPYTSDRTNQGPSRRTSSDAAPSLPRRLPQGNSTLPCSTLNRSLSNLSGCTAPLSREKSKLHLLSQHSSHHSSKTINSTGTLPRSSCSRRRPMERSVSGLTSTSDRSFDGNISCAQLQIGDCVMLGNKELSTSAHLIRRMPRQRRQGSRRSDENAPPRHSLSSSDEGVSTDDTLMERIAACSRE
jgi:hypothetical protein